MRRRAALILPIPALILQISALLLLIPALLGGAALAEPRGQSPEEHLAAARELIALDRLVEARAHVEAAAEAGGDLPTVLFLRARICFLTGATDGAMERLAEVSSLAPDWAAPRLLAAEIALAVDDPGRAAELYRAALDIDAGDPDVWIRYGDALARASAVDFDGPHQAYRAAIAADPGSEEAWIALTSFELNRRRFEQAHASVAEFLRRAPENPYALHLAGELRAIEGDSRGALEALNAALDRVDGAAAGAVDSTGVAPTARFRIDILELRSRLLLNLQRFAEAEADASEVLAAEPLNLAGFFVLGTALTRAGRREGESYLKSYQRLQESVVHRDLGYRFREKGDLTSATRELEHALRINPNDPVALTELAAVHLAEADYEAAIEALSRARRLGADGPDWHRRSIMALQAAGRADEARELWRQARERGLRFGPRLRGAVGTYEGAC